MRVLIVARPWSFHGGIETATAGLLRALVEHGHDVHLLSPGAAPPVAGVTARRLHVPPLPAAARVFALAALVGRAVRHGAWDVVQSHERTFGQDVYRAGEGCHRAFLAFRDARRGRPLYHAAVLALERRVFRKTPAIVAIARAGKAEIERLYGVPRSRVAVVYNGVDLERFHPRHRDVARATMRQETGVPAGAWAALFVGSGFARKGLAAAIDALSRLDDPNARLIVVGKGDTVPYAERAGRAGVADRVHWLGARADVERCYAASDAVVLPAQYEPFGNVHLEALAAGVPVVTSTRAGGAEVIAEGVNGAVRDPGDVGGIAAALSELRARDPRELAEAARRSAEPFTYARQVDALVAVWDRVRRSVNAVMQTPENA
jgi:UDP-glucose:(heptosyl)LPS alpha-1,3-glucosyltransferase